jgi:hypothetical protein
LVEAEAVVLTQAEIFLVVLVVEELVVLMLAVA